MRIHGINNKEVISTIYIHGVFPRLPISYRIQVHSTLIICIILIVRPRAALLAFQWNIHNIIQYYIFVSDLVARARVVLT